MPKGYPRLLTHRHRTQCLTAWARTLGITPCALRYRLEHWSFAEALSRPHRRTEWHSFTAAVESYLASHHAGQTPEETL